MATCNEFDKVKRPPKEKNQDRSGENQRGFRNKRSSTVNDSDSGVNQEKWGDSAAAMISGE
jgi:hypothetical protein